MSTPELTILLEKLLASDLSQEELHRLRQLTASSDLDAPFDAFIESVLLENRYAPVKGYDAEAVLAAVQQEIAIREEPQVVSPVHRVHFLRTAWFRYAAVLLLIAGTATFLYLNNRTQKDTTLTTNIGKPSDILPGGNKAILTLADGSTIVLDSAANGTLASQGNVQVLKLNAGKLAYKGGTGGEVLYNTISTPKGGQYQVELPDGSRVWLNAASSIRFPTVFMKDRKVSISGEVYFEVAADRIKPFLVSARDMNVEVLGTGFNVNAYDDEPAVKITLAEGAVKINNAVLKPGQAFVNGQVIAANLEQDLAWKNGLFNFEGIGVKELMRQVERWYDVEVVYTRNIPVVKFYGGMKRTASLADLLEALEKTGVYTRLEANRRIVVMP